MGTKCKDAKSASFSFLKQVKAGKDRVAMLEAAKGRKAEWIAKVEQLIAKWKGEISNEEWMMGKVQDKIRGLKEDMEAHKKKE